MTGGPGIFQGSLNYQFWGGHQTIQMYGNIEEFPMTNSALFGLVGFI